MTTPSPHQRVLALQAYHAHAHGDRVEAKFYLDPTPHQVSSMKLEGSQVFLRPRGYDGWLGAHHLESIHITKVH